MDFAAHHALALEVAQQGAVLLKNDDSLLPAPAEDLVLVGALARDFRYQGAGSSHINPTQLVSLADALPQVPCYPVGNALTGAIAAQELAQATDVARSARVAVVVAGLPKNCESEGFDRDTIAMPEGHLQLIGAVTAANPNTVVVLVGGSPMETPWIDQVKSVIYLGLSDQAGGQACANLLTGAANPSGKLTETWPLAYAQVPSANTFGAKNTEYRESIYVGYRYYDKAAETVRFPFGYGLSYTEFS